MKILIVLPSKVLKDPLIVEAEDYLARLGGITARCLFINPKSALDENQKEQRMKLEGQELLKQTAGYYRIALAENGQHLSSTQWADCLEKLTLRTSKIAFLIGGAFGLSREVMEASDMSLSLSAMTLPHRMALLLLSEQLYRASEIRRGSPYHK